MALSRTYFNTLVNETSPGSGTPIDITMIDAIYDDIDAALAALGNISASAYHNTTQSITTATWTQLSFNSEDFDNGGFHDTVTNNGRLTVPASQGGRYVIVGSAVIAAHATGARGLRILKNGTADTYLFMPSTGATFATIPTIVAIVSLAAADYVTLEVYQDSGTSLNAGNASHDFRNWFALVKVP